MTLGDLIRDVLVRRGGPGLLGERPHGQDQRRPPVWSSEHQRLELLLKLRGPRLRKQRVRLVLVQAPLPQAARLLAPADDQTPGPFPERTVQHPASPEHLDWFPGPPGHSPLAAPPPRLTQNQEPEPGRRRPQQVLVAGAVPRVDGQALD